MLRSLELRRTGGVIALERHDAVDDRAAVPPAERLGALAAHPQARRQRIHIPAARVCERPPGHCLCQAAHVKAL